MQISGKAEIMDLILCLGIWQSLGMMLKFCRMDDGIYRILWNMKLGQIPLRV